MTPTIRVTHDTRGNPIRVEWIGDNDHVIDLTPLRVRRVERVIDVSQPPTTKVTFAAGVEEIFIK